MAKHHIYPALRGQPVLVSHADNFVGRYLTSVLDHHGADVVVVHSNENALAQLGCRTDFAAAALSVSLADGPPSHPARLLTERAIPFLFWSAHPTAARLPDLPGVAVISWPFAAYQIAEALAASLPACSPALLPTSAAE